MIIFPFFNEKFQIVQIWCNTRHIFLFYFMFIIHFLLLFSFFLCLLLPVGSSCHSFVFFLINFEVPEEGHISLILTFLSFSFAVILTYNLIIIGNKILLFSSRYLYPSDILFQLYPFLPTPHPTIPISRSF